MRLSRFHLYQDSVHPSIGINLRSSMKMKLMRISESLPQTMISTSFQVAQALRTTSRGQPRLGSEHTGFNIGKCIGSITSILLVPQIGPVGLFEVDGRTGWVMRTEGCGWVPCKAPKWIRLVGPVGWIGWIESVGIDRWESAGWVKAHGLGDPLHGR